MEVNFGANPESPAATPAIDVAATASPVPVAGEVAANITPPAAVVTSPAQAVATTSKLLLGDRLPDFRDIIMPRLNMAQNIGGLKDTFDPGTLIYNQQVPLFVPGLINVKTQTLERPPTAPVTMIVLGFKDTRYCEKVKWGAEGGAHGLIVNSEEEVRANGGTLDYKEWQAKEKSGMKRFECLADCLVAIERPEIVADDDSVFNFEVEGKKFALALWGLRGTAYTSAAKRVLFPARRMGCLRVNGYPSWTWAVTVREEPYPGGVKAWIPIFIANKPSTPEQIKFAQSILGV